MHCRIMVKDFLQTALKALHVTTYNGHRVVVYIEDMNVTLVTIIH